MILHVLINELYKGNHFNGIFFLKIDALLLFNYKKNSRFKKNTKEMNFQIKELLALFGPPTMHSLCKKH